MSGKLIKCLSKASDCILGVRDNVGAALKEVFIVTRTWSGDRPGNGQPEDEVCQLLPTPRIVDYSHSIRLQEHGAVKQGDIILKGISKHKYPNEDTVRGKTSERNVEIFYRLGDDELYKVIEVVEKHLTWNVQIRRLSAQEANSGR